MTRAALENIVVLDFTRVLAGPFATMMLGDLGANVIKVEPPAGDESRSWPPFLENGDSGYFNILNRNKRSITLNLKDPAHKDMAHALAKKADVLVENFSPGVSARLGIDYETLSAVNPGLVYCSISGFGQTGPYRSKKAYDPIIQGMTGLMSITGEKGRSPVKVGIPITDLTCANQAVSAILAALIFQMKTGKGQYIDMALYDSFISMLTVMAMDYFVTRVPPERWGLDHVHRVPARAFKAKDGRYVQVAATSEAMYPIFCRIIEKPQLINHERFATNTLRVKNRDEIMPILEAAFKEKTAQDWLELFEKGGIPCGPILDLGQVFEDPNIEARGLRFQLPHPKGGSVDQLGSPYKLGLTPPAARLRPPLLGEHNAEVLMALLGKSRRAAEAFFSE